MVSAEGLEVSFPSMLIQAGDSIAAPKGFPMEPRPVALPSVGSDIVIFCLLIESHVSQLR